MIEPILKYIYGTVRFQERQTFAVATYGQAIGNNKSMLSIVNSGTKLMKLQGLYIFNSQTSPVTGTVSDFRLFRATGHSAGTLITPMAHDTADTIDVGIIARTNATITGEAATALRRWMWSSDEWGTGTLDVEANSASFQQLLSSVENPYPTKAITFRTNEGFTLKHVVNSTAGTFDILALITQE